MQTAQSFTLGPVWLYDGMWSAFSSLQVAVVNTLDLFLDAHPQVRSSPWGKGCWKDCTNRFGLVAPHHAHSKRLPQLLHILPPRPEAPAAAMHGCRCGWWCSTR